MTYDATLEEIWKIKREIAAEYPTLDDYFRGVLADQEEARARGVKFVSFPPRRPLKTLSTLCEERGAKRESVV